MGSPMPMKSKKTCDLLSSLARSHHHEKWVVFGDFNLVLSQEEKKGGNLVPYSHIDDMFREVLQSANLSDLGHEGDVITSLERIISRQGLIDFLLLIVGVMLFQKLR